MKVRCITTNEDCQDYYSIKYQSVYNVLETHPEDDFTYAMYTIKNDDGEEMEVETSYFEVVKEEPVVSSCHFKFREKTVPRLEDLPIGTYIKITSSVTGGINEILLKTERGISLGESTLGLCGYESFNWVNIRTGLFGSWPNDRVINFTILELEE